MKLFVNQGDIEVQAQNANLNMAAKQDVKVDSVDGKVTITAKDNLTLICGGSYIKISSEGIELGTQDNVYFKCNVMQKMGTSTKDIIEMNLPEVFNLIKHERCSMKFLLTDNEGQPLSLMPYIVRYDGSIYTTGTTDLNGYTSIIYSEKEIPLHIEIDIEQLEEKNVSNNNELD